MASNEPPNLATLYKDLFDEYKILNKTKPPQKAQQEFVAMWNKAKLQHTTRQDMLDFASNLLKEYRQQRKLRQAESITYYFSTKSSSQQVSAKIMYNNSYHIYCIIFFSISQLNMFFRYSLWQ